MPPMPPSTPLTPPRTHLILSAAYHPYACGVLSQHASDPAYHPYACSALSTCLQQCLPYLRSQCPPKMPPMLLTILMLAVPSRHASPGRMLCQSPAIDFTLHFSVPYRCVQPPTSCFPSNILPLPHACVILSDSYPAYAPAAPIDICPSLTPHVHNKPSLCFYMPPILSTSYHAYAPAAPYRYASPTTPCLPSPILLLPHTQFILSAAYHAYAPTVPSIYDSAPPTQSLNLHTPCHLPCLSCPQCPKYIPPEPLSMWYDSHF
ncbi:hypothetical protein O181_017191 [Austropuccinia psidii MF-1]|uniref:Uncharacterized protein n=1 Tax=Austropuccinia psidii MF-1 TaxID=1389203 RepID=A0A9Q3GRR8_9BASI|nr:hypothetical protein [Austropuccinia psidii MF-1]